MIVEMLLQAGSLAQPIATGGAVALGFAVVRVVERLIDRKMATKTEDLCTFEPDDGGKIRELHTLLTRRDGNWSLVQVLEKNTRVLEQLLALATAINRQMEAKGT